MSTNGCWVQFFDGRNMTGGTLRIEGPAEVPKLDAYHLSTGEKAGDEPDSLRTGSRAWLEVFSSENYAKTARQFDPNQSITDLAVYDIGGKIDSFKLYDERPSWWPGSSVSTPVEIDGGLVSSLTVNNVCRTLLGASLALVPKAGPFLKTLLYGLWPDPRNNMDQVWACFQNYISQVVGGIYQQIVITSLMDKLQGLYNLTRAYVEAPPEKRKGAFVALQSNLLAQEPFFISLEQPQNSLSFFVPFGTLMFAVQAEEILQYESIYGVPLSETQRGKLIDALQTRIEAYQAAVATARSDILAQRAAMVVVQDESVMSIGTEIMRAIDLYDGWRDAQYQGNDAERQATRRAAMRAESVTNELAYTLDQNLALTQLWTWFNPAVSVPLAPPTIIVRDGPYGQYQSTPYSCVAGAGKITQVAIWTGSLVDCLEVFVDGSSMGRQGRIDGDGGALQSLVLAAGESIVEANGYATGLINQLGFTTSTGRSILGGKDTQGSPYGFTSRPPSGTVDGCLAGISGYSENGTDSRANLKVVTFHWQCSLPFEVSDAFTQTSDTAISVA